jgi:hypothetical protein
LCTSCPHLAEVPQHLQPQPEREQQKHPRYDREHGAGGLGRQFDVRGMEGIADSEDREREQQRRPRVSPRPPASAAQGQGGSTRDHEHRVEYDRIQPGEFGSDTRAERDLVDSGIRNNEGRGGQQEHARDHGGERG